MATFNALRDQIVAYLRNGYLVTDNPYREFDVDGLARFLWEHDVTDIDQVEETMWSDLLRAYSLDVAAMKRFGMVLLAVVWAIVFVRVMTVDACCTDPIARLVGFGFLLTVPAAIVLRGSKRH